MSSSPVIRVFDCHICAQANDPSQDRQWLLLRRSQTKVYAGDWRMVGGKIDSVASLQGLTRETAWGAALREIREETKLKVNSLYTVPYVNHFYEWSHDRINCIPVFVAIVDLADPILDDEHSQWSWVATQEACSMLPWPAQREGLLAADKLLDGASPENTDEASQALAAHLKIKI